MIVVKIDVGGKRMIGTGTDVRGERMIGTSLDVRGGAYDYREY